jgi:hypothetical protein
VKEQDRLFTSCCHPLKRPPNSTALQNRLISNAGFSGFSLALAGHKRIEEEPVEASSPDVQCDFSVGRVAASIMLRHVSVPDTVMTTRLGVHTATRSIRTAAASVSHAYWFPKTRKSRALSRTLLTISASAPFATRLKLSERAGQASRGRLHREAQLESHSGPENTRRTLRIEKKICIGLWRNLLEVRTVTQVARHMKRTAPHHDLVDRLGAAMAASARQIARTILSLAHPEWSFAALAPKLTKLPIHLITSNDPSSSENDALETAIISSRGAPAVRVRFKNDPSVTSARGRSSLTPDTAHDPVPAPTSFPHRCERANSPSSRCMPAIQGGLCRSDYRS